MSVNLCSGDECAHCGESCVVVSVPIFRDDPRFPEPLKRLSDAGDPCSHDAFGNHYARKRDTRAAYAKCTCPRCGSPYWGIVFPPIWSEDQWDIVDMCYRNAINDEPASDGSDDPVEPVTKLTAQERIDRAAMMERKRARLSVK